MRWIRWTYKETVALVVAVLLVAIYLKRDLFGSYTSWVAGIAFVVMLVSMLLPERGDDGTDGSPEE